MTKAEYMNLVREKLIDFDEELQNEMLEDYYEHFAEGEAEGKTEEELIAELGDIEDMIASLRTAMGEGGRKATVAEVMCNDSVAENTRRQKFVYEGNYQKLVLSGSEAKVTIGQSPDDSVHLEYSDEGEVQEYVLEHYAEGNTIAVKIEHLSEERKGVFGFKNALSRQFREHCRQVILLEVKLPKEFSEITATTDSGSLKISDLHIVEMTAKTGNGGVTVANMQVKECVLGAGSGGIKCEELQAESLKAETGSGGVVCRKVQGNSVTLGAGSGGIVCEEVQAESIDMGTGSGGIVCSKVQGDNVTLGAGSGGIVCSKVSGETISVGTGSGGISGTELRATEIECGAGSGDVRVAATTEKISLSSGSGSVKATVRRAKKIHIETGSGKGEIQLAEIAGIKMVTESDYGDIELKWQQTTINCQGRNQKAMNLTLGDGSCEVKASTKSGKIKIAVE